MQLHCGIVAALLNRNIEQDPARNLKLWSLSQRITIQRHCHVHLHSVVHSLPDVLAACAVRAGDVPDRVAVALAFPAGGNRGRGCFEIGVGARDAPREAIERAGKNSII